jgi:hypothetical protein
MLDNPRAAYSGNQAMHVLFYTQPEPTTGIWAPTSLWHKSTC